MAYTTIDNPELYFQVKTYTGNGGTLAITLDGSEDMSPNFVWIKERNSTSSHALTDTVRGNTKKLKSDGNDAEETNTNLITSFDSDGFTLGNNGNANQSSSQTYVAWNWKAGTSFTNDASGTGIGSIDSAGSVNQDAGFSIISYTGTGSAATVAHGLGSAPRMIIIKDRSNSRNWGVYHQSMGNTYAMYLDLNNEKGGGNSSFWNSTSPTSSVFSINTRNEVNASSANMIAYCFAEKQGYSKFGSYAANENVNGSFIHLGFKPAFVILKQTNLARDWNMFDNKRSSFNAVSKYLRPNQSGSEDSGEEYVDFLSNGFKIKNTGNRFNDAGGTYIYMAFAEQPFVTSTGVPATAR